MPDSFDERWHRDALRGDGGAVDALARSAIGPLYRFCFYRLGGNGHLTEEVVQETLVRVIRDLEKYDPARAKGNIFAWLTGLARNEIRRALGREDGAVSLQTLWDKLDDDLRARVTLDGQELISMEYVDGTTLQEILKERGPLELDEAREIVKIIKKSKLKVQASINDDMVRVSGKDRDTLQEVMALVKEQEFPIDMQFTNYR